MVGISLSVTFTEALGAVCEDGVEDGQCVCERMSRTLRLTAVQAANELSAQR